MEAKNIHGYDFFLFHFSTNICVLLYIIMAWLKKQHTLSLNCIITFLIENITAAFEKKQSTLGIYLDLFKAFDRINHNISLSKLEHHGVQSNVLK